MSGTARPNDLRERDDVALDELTGVWNRAAFVAAAGPVFLSCGRRGTPVALVCFDLDFDVDRPSFSAADVAVVDRVLAATAEQLCRAFRDTDVIGRIDTFRFAVLLSDCTDDVVAAVEGRRTLTDPGSSLEAALFVSTVRATRGATFAGLMEQAEARAWEVQSALR